jgi:hypothetical protein
MISRDIPGAANKLATRTLLDHLLRSGTIAVENSKHVDLKHAPNIIFGQIKKGLDLCNTSVCDHDIERAEVFD